MYCVPKVFQRLLKYCFPLHDCVVNLNINHSCFQFSIFNDFYVLLVVLIYTILIFPGRNYLTKYIQRCPMVLMSSIALENRSPKKLVGVCLITSLLPFYKCKQMRMPCSSHTGAFSICLYLAVFSWFPLRAKGMLDIAVIVI